MIRRPINAQFNVKVLNGQKTTTIRTRPWPVGVPIMLYNWAGLPYRSRQVDVCEIVVKGFWTVRITHRMDGGMIYAYGRASDTPIHETEGFDSRSKMDEWFRPLVKPGQTIEKYLTLFRASI